MLRESCHEESKQVVKALEHVERLKQIFLKECEGRLSLLRRKQTEELRVVLYQHALDQWKEHADEGHVATFPSDHIADVGALTDTETSASQTKEELSIAERKVECEAVESELATATILAKCNTISFTSLKESIGTLRKQLAEAEQESEMSELTTSFGTQGTVESSISLASYTKKPAVNVAGESIHPMVPGKVLPVLQANSEIPGECTGMCTGKIVQPPEGRNGPHLRKQIAVGLRAGRHVSAPTMWGSTQSVDRHTIGCATVVRRNSVLTGRDHNCHATLTGRITVASKSTSEALVFPKFVGRVSTAHPPLSSRSHSPLLLSRSHSPRLICRPQLPTAIAIPAK